MSLYSSHNPKLSLTGSFASSLNLAEYQQQEIDHEALRKEKKKEKKKQKQIALRQSPRIDERTPLRPLPRDDSSIADYDSSSSSGDSANAVGTINATLLITIAAVTLGSSLQFGYATGVMNNSEAFIMQYFHDQGKEYTLMGWGTTVSSYGIGGLLGSVIGPKVIGRYCGRRATLLWNNVFLFLSSVLIALAPEWWYQAIGRIFVGIVAGVATAVVPTYFSEISPIAVRGAVGTMHQLGITVGILVSQALSTPSLNLLGSVDMWKWLFFVPVVCGFLELLILPFCPESPSYLYATQGKEAARQSLERLLPRDSVDQYLENIKAEVFATRGSSDSNDGGSMTVMELFRNKKLRKQLIVGITVQLMMQFSGIDAVFYYSTTVFYQADVADPELATTCLGIINVIVTIFAVKYMDSAGRKTLLTYSWVGLFFSFLTLTLSFILKPYFGCMDQLSVAATTGVIIFFAFGPGCIAWFIIAEIFPLTARDTAMTVGIFINWAANWLVAFTFPHLLEYTQPYTFLVFVATAAFFLFFTVQFVPETKGMTVAEIAEEFHEVPLYTC